MQDQSLISPSEIADLAGVSRAAVSNWRKREENFPVTQEGTSARPLFNLTEVTQWLTSRGYDVKKLLASETVIWSAANTLRGVLEVDDFGALFLSLACIRKAKGQAWLESAAHNTDRTLAQAVESVLASLHLWDPWINDPIEMIDKTSTLRIIEALRDVEDADLISVADHILERVARSQVKRGAEHGYVGSKVSNLMAKLASRHKDAQVFYDPSAGIGNALLQIAQATTAEKELVGQELNKRAAITCRQRGFLAGYAIDIAFGDTLLGDRHPNLEADVAVCEPPLGLQFDSAQVLADPRFRYGIPRKTSGDLLWVQHCVAHLADGGTGYVITTPNQLTVKGPGVQIRSGLLNDGCIKAVVLLPPRLYVHTAIPLALWVLGTPQKSTQDVLLIDASQLSEEKLEVAGWLDGVGLDTVPHAQVRVRDLLAHDAKLLPPYWVEPETPAPDEIGQQFADTRKAIHDISSKFNDVFADFEIDPRTAASRVMNVKDLISQGFLEYSMGRADFSQKKDTSIFTTKLVRTAELPPKRVSKEFSDPTQPGDVVVSSTISISAMVDPEGERRVGAGVGRLRIVNDDVLTPEYLAVMLEGPWNERYFTGSALQRVNIRDLEVPLIPVEAQRHLAALATRAKEISKQTQALSEHAENLAMAVRNAARYGLSTTAGVSQR